MAANFHSPFGCPRCNYTYVPQREYQPRRGTRMEAFEAKQIMFRSGGICGIPVKDGISRLFGDLEDRDSRPFEGVEVADQVTLRIEWPGYPPWFAYFRVRGSTSARNSVTLSELAERICKAIKKFIDEEDGKPCTDDAWRVGRDTALNVDTLALVSLERASYGSWVASIRLV